MCFLEQLAVADRKDLGPGNQKRQIQQLLLGTNASLVTLLLASLLLVILSVFSLDVFVLQSTSSAGTVRQTAPMLLPNTPL